MNLFYTVLGRFFLVGAVVLLLVSSVACSGDDDSRGPSANGGLRNLTFVYMMAENSLSGYATFDILEMMSAAAEIPDDCALIVFVDDVLCPRICRIRYGTEGAVCDTIYTFEKDFASSGVDNARMVFRWVGERYAAQTVNVVLWSHGSGWVASSRAPGSRSIGVDNGENSYSNAATAALEISDIPLLLAELPVRPSVLMFDACFMQTLETAYELRNCARWIVASPAEIPAEGAPYDLLLEHFFARTISSVDIVDAYCAAYTGKWSGVVLSVVNCDAMEQLAACCRECVPEAFERVRGEAEAAFSYLPGGYSSGGVDYYPDFTDANAVMQKALDAASLVAWREALDRAVPYRATTGRWYSAVHRINYKVDYANYCGVSMYVPREDERCKAYNADFSSTAWYKAAGWSLTGW